MSVVSANGAVKITFNDREHTPKKVGMIKRSYQWLRTYFSKWTGQHKALPAPPPLFDSVVGLFSTFIGITILAVVHYRLLTK